jgi:hypothetical protein
MREMPEVGDESSGREEVRRRRIELSFPQVAGSAVAAVVAAKLASYFGVYGTILGAGVVSVVATCGGSVFQHFFSRTGEQIRDATVIAKPLKEQPLPDPGEFTEGTVYRARIRSWRRPLLAAAVVFGITMGGITVYEMVSGSSFSGGTGTTVSDAFTGSSPSRPADVPSPSSTESPTSPTVSPTPEPTSTPTSTAGTGGTTGTEGSAQNGGGATDAPTPSPSASANPQQGDRSRATTAPTPAPSSSAKAQAPYAGSRSGNAGPDPAGSAAP